VPSERTHRCPEPKGRLGAPVMQAAGVWLPPGGSSYRGVTSADLADAALVPTALMATTVNR
jgi:hypothetical protein